MKDDIDAYSFIERLLTDSRAVTPNGDIIYEKKGIMAGVPLSSFLANVYLCQLDWYFYNNGNSCISDWFLACSNFTFVDYPGNLWRNNLRCRFCIIEA